MLSAWLILSGYFSFFIIMLAGEGGRRVFPCRMCKHGIIYDGRGRPPHPDCKIGAKPSGRDCSGFARGRPAHLGSMNGGRIPLCLDCASAVKSTCRVRCSRENGSGTRLHFCKDFQKGSPQLVGDRIV